MRKFQFQNDDTKQRYISRKTKDLREFGYESLTRDEVEKCLDKVLSGEEAADVISMFIEDDIKKAEAVMNV